MKIKAIAALLALTCAGTARAASQPVWQLVSSSEYYFILPTAQTISYSGGGRDTVHPWGFGFRAVGQEPLTHTGALQFQRVSVVSPAGSDSFYMLDMLLGMEYKSPKRPGKPLRFTASASADLGLSDTTFYAAPVLSAGLLYTANEQAETPTGLTLGLYYRFTDINLHDAGHGRAGTLNPALGLKLGYIFEGFWAMRGRK